MMKAVVWDLDGTLFDSYDVIVESILLTFRENGIDMDWERIHQYAIEFSIKELFSQMAKLHGVSAEDLHRAYSGISQGKYLQIKRMPHTLEILEILKRAGVEQYVFTHRGKTTIPVLENLHMDAYFQEVVTTQNSFARKPDPEGLIYLMEKYNLDKESTWYVGDRSLDMDCAKNAGIPGILYMPSGAIDVSGGTERYIVNDLLEIQKIVLN